MDRVRPQLEAGLEASYGSANVSVFCGEPQLSAVEAKDGDSSTHSASASAPSLYQSCAFKGASALLKELNVADEVYLPSSNTITQEGFEDLGSLHAPASFTA